METAEQTRRANLVVLLDTIERVALLALYGYFTYRIALATASQQNPLTFLILVSEGAILAFLLFRRRTNTLSLRFQDWAVAFLGTTLPLLATPSDVAPLVPPAVGGCLMVLGIVTQIYAKLILRRRFGVVAANRGVVSTGPYRFVRHPMYLGYLIAHIGFLLLMPTLWNVAVYSAAFLFQVARIIAEEDLLSMDPAYQDFRASVRFKIIPGVF